MDKNELLRKVHQLKELQRMAEEIEAEAETIKDEIKAEMTAQDTDTLVIDCFKVTWKPVTTNRFDSKAFKKKYEQLYNEYTKPTVSKRFTIN